MNESTTHWLFGHKIHQMICHQCPWHLFQIFDVSKLSQTQKPREILIFRKLFIYWSQTHLRNSNSLYNKYTRNIEHKQKTEWCYWNYTPEKCCKCGRRQGNNEKNIQMVSHLVKKKNMIFVPNLEHWKRKYLIILNIWEYD